jgi:uncharacterized protein (DUF1778 family)
MTAKEYMLRARLSNEEKALLEKAAKSRGLTLSAYVRMVALEQAKKDLRK